MMPLRSKKTVLILAGLICFLGLGVHTLINLPSKADEIFREKVRNAGFIEATIPAPDKRLRSLRYQNIILDKDERNTIDTLILDYGILDLIFKKKIRMISVRGLYLSGEIDRYEKLEIYGLPLAFPNNNIDAPAFDTLSIKDANLSLITAHLGGVRLTFDTQVKADESGYTVTSSLNSDENQFQMLSKLNGVITPSGNWTMDWQIENGKMERDNFKITRASGTARVEGHELNLKNISGEIRSGAMNLYETPWQNTTITVKGSGLKDLKTYIESKSGAHDDGLELSIEAVRKQNNFDWNGRVFTDNIFLMQSYLERQEILPYNVKNFPELNAPGPTEVLFKNNSGTIIFMVRNLEDKNISFKGSIEMHKNKKYAISKAL